VTEAFLIESGKIRRVETIGAGVTSTRPGPEAGVEAEILTVQQNEGTVPSFPELDIMWSDL